MVENLNCQFEQTQGHPLRNLQLDNQLATSTDYYFGSDNVALRATFRFGQKIADTARVVELTVAGAGSYRPRAPGLLFELLGPAQQEVGRVCSFLSGPGHTCRRRSWPQEAVEGPDR